jgi:hypothetical protein
MSALGVLNRTRAEVPFHLLNEKLPSHPFVPLRHFSGDAHAFSRLDTGNFAQEGISLTITRVPQFKTARAVRSATRQPVIVVNRGVHPDPDSRSNGCQANSNPSYLGAVMRNYLRPCRPGYEKEQDADHEKFEGEIDLGYHRNSLSIAQTRRIGKTGKFNPPMSTTMTQAARKQQLSACDLAMIFR